MESEKPTQKPQEESLLKNLSFNLIIPVLLLTKGSKFIDSPVTVLLLALAFPTIYFILDYRARGKANFISILGFISILLTGGVGLLELPRFWFIVKETAIPAIIGLVVLGSMYTKYPLIRTLLYNPKMFDVEKIQNHLHERKTENAFEALLRKSTWLLVFSFALSAVLNFLVASHFIQTEPAVDPVQFNAEVGAMTGWSYLIIALPSTAIMIAIFFYITRGIKSLTGLTLEACMAEEHRQKMEEK